MQKPFTNAQRLEEIKRLLARSPVVQGACELDLLVFLHRHPRSLLTNEQLAAFVGYDTRQVAKSLEAFIDGGLVERTQNPNHAARLYLLTLNSPHGGGLTTLVELASKREGRRDVLEVLKAGPSPTGRGAAQGLRRAQAA